MCVKVLNIAFSKDLGGLEQMFLRYNEAFLFFGWHVTTLLANDARLKPFVEDSQSKLIESSFISSSLHQYNPFAVFLIRRMLKKTKPDIVFLHNTRPLGLLKKAAKNICPIVVVNHGEKPKQIESIDYLVAITRYIERESRQSKQFKGVCYYVPNVYDAEYSSTPRASGSDVLKLGFIGRLDALKGVKYLLESTRYFDFPYEVIIAGDGVERHNLEKKAQELGANVTFIGWVNDKSKQNFFDNIDVLVVPSEYEAFGLVIIEGWAANKPVIASKTKGACELIKHQKNGLLFERNNPEAITTALQLFLKSDARQLCIGGKLSLKNYSKDVFREKLQTATEAIITDYQASKGK